MPKADIPKVLVVNDDQASLLALSALLLNWANDGGYEVVSVDSGVAALRELLNQDFAVIFLDVNMPGMDGFETAEAIRKHPRCSGTPIIFVTSYLADDIDRAKAYSHGASDFLFTPVIPQILRAKTWVFVALAAKNAATKKQAAMLARKEVQLVAANARLQHEMQEGSVPSGPVRPRTISLPCSATSCAIP